VKVKVKVDPIYAVRAYGGSSGIAPIIPNHGVACR